MNGHIFVVRSIFARLAIAAPSGLLALALPKAASASCSTGVWTQTSHGCAASIAAGAGKTEGFLYFEGCGTGFVEQGQGGADLWSWNLQTGKQANQSSAHTAHANKPYNTLVDVDDGGFAYMWTSGGDWYQWNGAAWSNYGYSGYSSLAVSVGGSGVTYGVNGDVFATFGGAFDPGPYELPSTGYLGNPVKVGINTHYTVTCFPPGTGVAYTYPTVWMMTDHKNSMGDYANNLYRYSASSVDCTGGSWTQFTSQSAQDIAGRGTSYLGVDGDIYDSTTSACEYTGHNVTGIAEDEYGCISVLDGAGNIFQENASCGF